MGEVLGILAQLGGLCIQCLDGFLHDCIRAGSVGHFVLKLFRELVDGLAQRVEQVFNAFLVGGLHLLLLLLQMVCRQFVEFQFHDAHLLFPLLLHLLLGSVGLLALFTLRLLELLLQAVHLLTVALLQVADNAVVRRFLHVQTLVERRHFALGFCGTFACLHQHDGNGNELYCQHYDDNDFNHIDRIFRKFTKKFPFVCGVHPIFLYFCTRKIKGLSKTASKCLEKSRQVLGVVTLSTWRKNSKYLENEKTWLL